MAFGDGIDGEEIGDAVEHKHSHHGAGELDVERLGHGGEARAQPVLNHAPAIQRRPRIGERKAEHHRRQAELLKAENGGEQPDHRGDDAKHDGAAGSPIGPLGVGQIPP
jgi:hypothetical protein